MPGSQYFLDKKAKSLNSFVSDDGQTTWQPDKKYSLEVIDALLRAKMDLNDGILTKYSMLRMRQVEQKAIKSCYEKKGLSFVEAEQCEEFHYKNDYKLN